MGFLGTRADGFTDGLILGEILITLLVVLGVRLIRRNRVAKHRLVMLSALGINLGILSLFLLKDVFVQRTTLERGSAAPGPVWVPLFVLHLLIAVSSLGIAVWAWWIARRGVVRDGQGAVVNVTPDVRKAHRRISRFFPWLWYSTLATGLLFYATVYVVRW